MTDRSDYEDQGRWLELCYEDGFDSAMEGKPDYADYKDWDECNAFHDGYQDGLKEKAKEHNND